MCTEAAMQKQFKQLVDEKICAVHEDGHLCERCELEIFEAITASCLADRVHD